MAAILHVIKGSYVCLKYIMIENRPADSRVKIKDDGICQSLTSRMGTGGGQCAVGALLHQIKKSAEQG